MGWLGVSETIDRVVASIGNAAITRSEVEAEYRFEFFFDGKVPAPEPDLATLARVCDRLIAQKLLAEEAAAEGTEQADPPEKTAEILDEVRRRYGSNEAWEAALRVVELDQQQILARITAQEITLRMIDHRFRPAAWPERSEIEAYYRETFSPAYAQRNAGPVPPIADVENQIREILTQKNINRLFEAWLEEMKSSRRVKVYAF